MADKVKCTRIIKKNDGTVVGYRLSDGIKSKDVAVSELISAVRNGLIEVTNLKLKTQNIESNIEKYDKYMKKQGLIGKKVFEFEVKEETDEVLIKKIYTRW